MQVVDIGIRSKLSHRKLKFFKVLRKFSQSKSRNSGKNQDFFQKAYDKKYKGKSNRVINELNVHTFYAFFILVCRVFYIHLLNINKNKHFLLLTFALIN